MHINHKYLRFVSFQLTFLMLFITSFILIASRTSYFFDLLQRNITHKKFISTIINHENDFELTENLSSFEMGILKREQGDIDRAIFFFGKSLEEGNELAVYPLGEAYFKAGDTDAAIDVWQSLNPVIIEKIAFEFGINAERARNNEQWDKVENFGIVAIALDPRQVRAWRHLAVAYSMTDQDAQAEKAFRSAQSLAVDNKVRAEILVDWGNFSRNRGNNDDAISLYNQAVATNPGSVRGWSMLAQLYKDLGNMKLFSEANQNVLSLQSNIDD